MTHPKLSLLVKEFQDANEKYLISHKSFVLLLVKYMEKSISYEEYLLSHQEMVKSNDLLDKIYDKMMLEFDEATEVYELLKED